VDATAPQTTIDTGPTGATNDKTPTFAFSSSETGSSFECRVDNASFAPCSSSTTTAELVDGSHTFAVRATDAVGNTDTSPATRTFSVDTTAPQTTIDSGPTGPTNAKTPTFAFSSESAATFECKLDGPGATTGSYTACSSPKDYISLADGNYTFSVRATDATGNVDPSPATTTFTVDTTAPQTTIDTGATGTTNDKTPTFTFSSTETGSDFECRVDEASFAPCSSPMTTAELNDGSHTLAVRATDAAGNADTTPATRTFSVDTTAPQTTIDSAPTSPTNDNTPTFTFSSEAGGTFECRVDDAGFAPCESPTTTAELTDGSHTFAVRATDPAGNTDTTPASRTFTVDTGPPQTTLDAGPTGAVNDRSASFGFSSSEAGATFECKLDGPGSATSDYAACTSPKDYSSLADGSYTFSVRATDTTDNTDPSPATRTFAIDTTAPQTTIESGPTGTTSDATPTFTFASTEAGSSYECRVDDAGFAACSSPETTQVLSDGSHRFEVRATDPAGNRDSTAASRTFSVSTSTPQPADSDGDGVPNTRDHCPTQPAPASDGCPSVAAPPQSSVPPPAQSDDEAPSLIGRTGLTRTIKSDSRGRLTLTIGRFDEEAEGVIRLETTAKPSAGSSRSSAARKSKVRLGLKRFTARPGTKVVVRIRLSKSNRRLLNRTHKLKVRAILSTTDKAGNRSTKTYRFTLKAPS
jgi:hypothetical protein